MRRPRGSVRIAAAAAFGLALVVYSAATAAQRGLPGPPVAGADEPVATFSIVAFDPQTGDLGVAVASKALAVGRIVPYASAGVGAVATQALANVSYGPDGLDLLSGGNAPAAVVERLLADDDGRDDRQVGVVGSDGRTATYTGAACLPWAGGRQGDNYAVQGNLLTGPEVIDAMAAAFENAEGDLARRMVAALAAGQEAGGDARGRQSAAVLVVREDGGFGAGDDRYVDLRVDDHERPITELARLLDLQRALLAEGAARQALVAAGRDEAERVDQLAHGTALATEATRLDPGNGWAWLTLAELRLAAGNRDGAVAAGLRAIREEPWIKAAIIRGIRGSTRLIETLLADEAFRRAWQAIEVG